MPSSLIDTEERTARAFKLLDDMAAGELVTVADHPVPAPRSLRRRAVGFVGTKVAQGTGWLLRRGWQALTSSRSDSGLTVVVITSAERCSTCGSLGKALAAVGLVLVLVVLFGGG